MKEADEFSKHFYNRERSFRQGPERIMEVLRRMGHENDGTKGHPVKMAYMPFIMIIGPDGATNNEIAQHANVSKQAMSKVMKELQELGFIIVKPHEGDKRSSQIYLSDKGKEFVLQARICMNELMEEYRQAIGQERYETMIDVMLEITAYNTKFVAENKGQ